MSEICVCGHTLGFHGFPDARGVVLRYRDEPCAWGHVWPTLDEPRCECVKFSSSNPEPVMSVAEALDFGDWELA